MTDEAEEMMAENQPSDASEDTAQDLSVGSETPEVAAAGGEGAKHEERRPVSAQVAEFQKRLEGESSGEVKVRLALDFMKEALAGSGTPRFKDFWDCRRLCVDLFKESIAPKVRAQMWAEYIELSTEARRLKEILDEQSAFAIEQIELAILSFERDLEQYPALLQEAHDIALPKESEALRGRFETYNNLQRELHFLNNLATRINALRKEIIKTEMRIRIKNKLLERLSNCGDRVFPRRKELIKQVSDEFLTNVSNFVAAHFHADEIDGLPLFVLREEIKMLQQAAKVLTLNTHAFTETRQKLSKCWDKIRVKDKERKREVQQKRVEFKQNFDLVMEQIKVFAEACQGQITADESNKQASAIFDFMRTVQLGKEDIRDLREEISRARKAIVDREREAEQQRQQKERELETKRRDQINALKDKLAALLKSDEKVLLDELETQRQALWQEFEEMTMSKVEKQIIERLFKQLKEAMMERKEKALLSLSEDDLKALEQLQAHLTERKERRKEIKNQLEQYRKVLGGSGFDFEKAMTYRELIETEKQSLDKIEASIAELEERIEEIEG